MKDCELVDSHVHLDLVAAAFPERLRWWKEHRCAVISWSFCGRIEKPGDLENYFRHQVRAVERARADQGLEAFFLAGIHPRDIPAGLDPSQVPDLLAPLLDHPLCLGLGEIGLETGSALEQDILATQLEFARSRLSAGVRIGIHTPRTHKAPITRQLLGLLGRYDDLRPVIVVDHCSPVTLPLVLEAGFAAGITLSPIKTGARELETMVADHGAWSDRIMCNTDSGSQFFEDLVKNAGNLLLGKRTGERVFYRNAARFFGLEQRGIPGPVNKG